MKEIQLNNRLNQLIKDKKYQDAWLLGEPFLEKYPQSPQFLLAMGLSAFECKPYEVSVNLFEQLIALKFNQSNVRTIVLHILERLFNAQEYVLMNRLVNSLCHSPYANEDTWNFLGISWIQLVQFHEAKYALEKALTFNPRNEHILTNLGNVYMALSEPAAAVNVLLKAIEINPKSVPTLNNLGNALRTVGDYENAEKYFTQGIATDSNYGEFYANRGALYLQMRRFVEAMQDLQFAAQLKPDLPENYYNMIDVLRQAGQLNEAIKLLQESLEKFPENQEIWMIYGTTLRDANLLDQAIQANIKALSLKSKRKINTRIAIYTNLLFCLNYHPNFDAQTIFSAYQDFNQEFCEPLKATWQTHSNQRNLHKRLKVGYVSQSYYSHVIKNFLLPLFENHQHQDFEIYAYANNLRRDDEFTERFRNSVDHWINTKGMSDEQMAQKIREDGIDILVDIAGHTADNRLLVFARKPAPVSLHWLDYGYTTGLNAIDYYLTDAIGIAPEDESYFSEKIWRLDGAQFVYQPYGFADNVTIGDLPFDKKGYITFGCLSRAIRINHKVIQIWSAILDAMPDSHLIIDSENFKDVEAAELMAQKFVAHGIERERVQVSFNTPSWKPMQDIDIMLDCFPHNSGTTLIEALYMGVPFITKADRTSIGRIGASVLAAVGHSEWIASTEEEYAQKAVILAHDIEQLRYVRKNLRQEMENSLLMNEKAFAQSVERAYRQMWEKFCKENP